MPIKNVAVIGSGFAGLSAACYLAKAGYRVDVYEKNEQCGGRARQLTTGNGYIFDMGPSWYWMPDVFERFFADFSSRPQDFYRLDRLDPGFCVIFGKKEAMNIPASLEQLCCLFERIEQGSGPKLLTFLEGAAYKYHTGMERLVYKPGLSFLEFADTRLLAGLFRLEVFTPFSKHVRKYFRDQRLIALMEFPVLFLGAAPENTPALYSLMNYAGLKLGTWYPQGGFGQVVTAMENIAGSTGVNFYRGETVTGITAHKDKVSQLVTTKRTRQYDGVVAAADYHHVETMLLENRHRNYSKTWWDKRVLAPSSLIFYLGVNKKLDRLQHHNLFFDADMKQHTDDIYRDPKWPDKPLFYVCCPSRSDETVAPPGHENLFILMPLAPDLEDNEELRQSWFNKIMDRLEEYTAFPIRSCLDYQKSYCITDFKNDYHSFRGNAYGLANTLRQTANLKPSIRNKNLKNLFYAGQLTVPGPGVPPAIISGKIAAMQLIKYMGTDHEKHL
jgi:phytoene desaturase